MWKWKRQRRQRQMLQTATIWTALNFLLATEIRSDILAGCSSEITNTSNFFCVEEMHLYSDCRADAIKSLQDCRWAEIMQLRSAAEIHFLQDWELPPLVDGETATTAIHWDHHRAPVILDKRSVKDRVVCDASGGKQDGVDGCSKSVILWWKYWMTTEAI